jgi:L-lactate dehydrogenase complex protein LldF
LRETPGVRESVGSATRTFDALRTKAYADVDSDRWRDWARDVKTHTLTHLDAYLEQAEQSLLANGAHVHWAASADDVHRVLADVVSAHGVRTVVKGKSSARRNRSG